MEGIDFGGGAPQHSPRPPRAQQVPSLDVLVVAPIYARDGEEVCVVYIASAEWEPLFGQCVTASLDEAVDGIQDVELVLVSGNAAISVPWSIVVLPAEE